MVVTRFKIIFQLNYVLYVDRSLLVFNRNHAWVSFEGFTEAYKETFPSPEGKRVFVPRKLNVVICVVNCSTACIYGLIVAVGSICDIAPTKKRLLLQQLTYGFALFA